MYLHNNPFLIIMFEALMLCIKAKRHDISSNVYYVRTSPFSQDYQKIMDKQRYRLKRGLHISKLYGNRNEEATSRDINLNDIPALSISYFSTFPANNIHKLETEVAEMECANALTTVILRRKPKASFMWYKNGDPLTMDPSRMAFADMILFIQSLAASDEGVYTCAVEYEPKMVQIVALHALTVSTITPQVQIAATEDLFLDCHASVFLQIFSSLMKSWYRNDTIYGMIRNVTNRENDSRMDKFENANKNFTGVWTCDISIGQQIWHTSNILVEVGPEPSTIIKLRNLIMHNPIYLGLAIGVVLFAAVTCLCFYVDYNRNENSKVAYESLKKRLVLNVRDSNEDISQHAYDSDGSTDCTYAINQPEVDLEALMWQLDDDRAASYLSVHGDLSTNSENVSEETGESETCD